MSLFDVLYLLVGAISSLAGLGGTVAAFLALRPKQAAKLAAKIHKFTIARSPE